MFDHMVFIELPDCADVGPDRIMLFQPVLDLGVRERWRQKPATKLLMMLVGKIIQLGVWTRPNTFAMPRSCHSRSTVPTTNRKTQIVYSFDSIYSTKFHGTVAIASGCGSNPPDGRAASDHGHSQP